MASALTPEFHAAFDRLATEFDDLQLVDVALAFLEGDEPAPFSLPAKARRPPFEAPPPLRIHAALRALVGSHGLDLVHDQVRELVLSYARAGARRQLAKRQGRVAQCPDCAAREAAAHAIDAGIRRVATRPPESAIDTEVSQ